MLADNFDFGLMMITRLVFVVTSLTALVMAAMAREDAYRAADKKTKSFWLIILGLAAAVNLIPFISMLFLSIAGLIAAIVFFVDVRPALQQVSGGGGRRGRGSSSDGPYGPWNGGR
ncbi:DUF2516 family protein [Streptomyces sp. NPDC005805]|uniref:DUF2516 family protein n=1 Tax=Streptomyces sp. NPDC005805 TaxID=3157068 RepID=UPI0033C4B717